MSRRWIPWLLAAAGILALGGLTIRLALVAADPGPLAAPHAKILAGGGWRNCRKCHTATGITDGCRACHHEIALQQDHSQGYHGLIAHQGDRDCQGCHPEHLGGDYALQGPVAWQGQDPNAFTHEYADFRLIDRHGELTCDDCHNASFVEPFTLKEYPESIRTSSFLGLSQECVACHEDIHAAGRASDCESCHDQSAFKPAPHFRHDDYFVLEGVHAQTECAGCHLWEEPDPMSTDAPLVRLPFQTVRGTTCMDCHESPHRTDFGKNCIHCHEAKDSAWSLGQRGVDLLMHSLTGFDLTDAHANVACTACHSTDLPYADRYPDPCDLEYQRKSEHCSGCHQDPHQGQFAQEHVSCLDCHTQETFHPSTVTVARHADFYELVDAHVETACESCHKRHADTQVQQFVGTSRHCRDCHADPHESQFMDPNLGDRPLRKRYASCLDCHTQKRFLPSTVTVGRHAEFFELKESHTDLACAACHKKQSDTQDQQFVGISRECKDCHEDPHQGQFQDRYSSCSECHSQTRFTPVFFGLEQHDVVYPLAGAHRAVACTQCHQPHEALGGTRRYRHTPQTCAACHRDTHRGQFLQEGQVRCERCHGHTLDWKAERFDHEQNSAFPLEGEHQKVSCAKCHPDVVQPDGTYVTQYRPVSTRCEDCHGFSAKP